MFQMHLDQVISFNGKQEKNFVNPNDELVPFQQFFCCRKCERRFEYDGGEGTAPKIVGDIATVYAPYDANLLPEQQAVSRTKTFYF